MILRQRLGQTETFDWLTKISWSCFRADSSRSYPERLRDQSIWHMISGRFLDCTIWQEYTLVNEILIFVFQCPTFIRIMTHCIRVICTPASRVEILRRLVWLLKGYLLYQFCIQEFTQEHIWRFSKQVKTLSFERLLSLILGVLIFFGKLVEATVSVGLDCTFG